MGCLIKKILVTGSTGFVGGRFIQDFKDTYNIKTVNLRTTRPQDIDFSGIEAVVHCAALVHQMKGAPDEEYFRVNRDLTVELAKEARRQGVEHFIFLSTAHVFGDSGSLDHSQVLKSSSPCSPKDGYGRSKLAAENELSKLQSKNFKVSILRPPMVYGEGAKGNLVKLAKLIQKMPILPFGYTKNKRSLIYVGNLTHFIHRVIESEKGGIFLPQDERPLSISEITELIAKSIDKKIYQIPIPHLCLKIMELLTPKLVTRLYGTLALDSVESKEKIGYQPTYPTKEGIKKMVRSIPKE